MATRRSPPPSRFTQRVARLAASAKLVDRLQAARGAVEQGARAVLTITGPSGTFTVVVDPTLAFDMIEAEMVVAENAMDEAAAGLDTTD
jgi:hypothetical protein